MLTAQDCLLRSYDGRHFCLDGLREVLQEVGSTVSGTLDVLSDLALYRYPPAKLGWPLMRERGERPLLFASRDSPEGSEFKK